MEVEKFSLLDQRSQNVLLEAWIQGILLTKFRLQEPWTSLKQNKSNSFLLYQCNQNYYLFCYKKKSSSIIFSNNSLIIMFWNQQDNIYDLNPVALNQTVNQHNWLIKHLTRKCASWRASWMKASGLVRHFLMWPLPKSLKVKTWKSTSLAKAWAKIKDCKITSWHCQE